MDRIDELREEINKLSQRVSYLETVVSSDKLTTEVIRRFRDRLDGILEEDELVLARRRHDPAEEESLA